MLKAAMKKRLNEGSQTGCTNLGDLLLHEVEDSSRRGDDEVNVLEDPHDVVLEVGATGRDHDSDAQVLRKLDGDL